MHLPDGNPRSTSLSAYWNALTAHAPAETLAALRTQLDPLTAALIDQIRSEHIPFRPDPRFADQLERDLRAAMVTTPAGNSPFITMSPPSLFGRLLGRDQSVPGERRPGPRAIGGVAAVVVVLAILLYSLWQPSNQAVLPPSPRPATPTDATPQPVSSYRGNSARTGVMPGPAPDGMPGVLWYVQADDRSVSGITVANGIAYVGSNDGVIRALNTDTGAELWSLTTAANDLSPYTVIQDDILYVAGSDGMARALDARTGAEIWRTDANLPVGNQMVLDGQTLYVGGLDAMYYAVNTSDGTLLWRTALGGVPSSVAPAFANGRVYTAAGDGLVYALDAKTGVIDWTQNTGYPLSKALSVFGTTLYVPTGIDDPSHWTLAALNTETGEQQWVFDSPVPGSLSSVTAYQSILLMGSEAGRLYALDRQTGTALWTLDKGEGAIGNSGISLVGDTAYFVSVDGYVYAVEAGTGKFLWRVKLDGSISMTPAITGGRMYVGTWAGGIYALGDTGKPPGTPDEGTAIPSPVDGTPASPVATTPVGGPANAALVWSSTGPPGGMRFPAGLGVAPDGTIWVADTGNNCFRIFAPDGTFLETWGEFGTGIGQFRMENASGGYGTLVFAPDGSFYVLDTGNFRIQHFAADRTWLNMWGTFGRNPGQFSLPLGLAIDRNGDVYVYDDTLNTVQVFASDGSWLRQVDLNPERATTYVSGNSITVDGDGNIYFSQMAPEEIVFKFDPDGNRIGSFGDASGPGQFLGQPAYIVIDGTGQVYVGSMEVTGMVRIFAPDGTFFGNLRVDANPDDFFIFPTGIALIPGGIIINDGYALTVNKIQLLSPLASEISGATPIASPLP